MEDPRGIIVPVFLGLMIGLQLQPIIYRWLERNPLGACYRIMGRPSGGRLRWLPFGLRFFLPILGWRLGVIVGILWFHSILLALYAEGAMVALLVPLLVLSIASNILWVRTHTSGLLLQIQTASAFIAAGRVARQLDAPLAVDSLLQLGAMQEVHFKTIAAKYLGRIGTEAAISALNRLSQQEDAAVQRAAEEALEETRTMRSRKFGNDFKKLAQLLLAYRQHLRPVYSKVHDKHLIDGKALTGFEEEIDQFLLPQTPLKWSFPHVYCTRCNSRVHDHAELGWWWLACKVCGEADAIIGDVQRAVGQIGGPEQPRLEAGEYIFELWDNKRKIAAFAEIDALEIVGGSAVDYDWAVSRVVEMVGKHFPERMGKLQIRLIHDPALEANSLRLLKELGSVVR